MRKVQTEIDGVVGRDRLPDFGDMESLPYLRAVISETMRYDFDYYHRQGNEITCTVQMETDNTTWNPAWVNIRR